MAAAPRIAVADGRVGRQGLGVGVAARAEGQPDHRVVDGVELEPGGLGLGDQRADDVVGGPEGHARAGRACRRRRWRS